MRRASKTIQLKLLHTYLLADERAMRHKVNLNSGHGRGERGSGGRGVNMRQPKGESSSSSPSVSHAASGFSLSSLESGLHEHVGRPPLPINELLSVETSQIVILQQYCCCARVCCHLLPSHLKRKKRPYHMSTLGCTDVHECGMWYVVLWYAVLPYTGSRRLLQP